MRDMQLMKSCLQKQKTPGNHYAWTKLGALIYVLWVVAAAGIIIGFLWLWGLALGN